MLNFASGMRNDSFLNIQELVEHLVGIYAEEMMEALDDQIVYYAQSQWSDGHYCLTCEPGDLVWNSCLNDAIRLYKENHAYA